MGAHLHGRYGAWYRLQGLPCVLFPVILMLPLLTQLLVMTASVECQGVNMVINYDFPPSAVEYIHRIGEISSWITCQVIASVSLAPPLTPGRTGRAGRAGSAITLFTERDVIALKR